MEVLREFLLNSLLLSTMSLSAGAAIMILHGLLMRRRLSSGVSLSECVTKKAWILVTVSVLSSLLLATQSKTVHWDWLGTLLLLVGTAPALLAWLGPPNEHVEDCNLCQIGRGSIYGHVFGYLRLMQGEHGIRKRLVKFRQQNPAGIAEDKLQNFYTDAVIVLAPTDGQYPSGSFSDLNGVGAKVCEMPSFQCTVGGNKRSYGGFGIYEVTSSGGEKRYVALDKVGALGTLGKLKQYGPAGPQQQRLREADEGHAGRAREDCRRHHPAARPAEGGPVQERRQPRGRRHHSGNLGWPRLSCRPARAARVGRCKGRSRSGSPRPTAVQSQQ